MALAHMLKVEVIGYRSIMDDVVSVVQQEGVLHVDATPFDLPTEEVPTDDQRIRSLEEHSAKVHFIRDFLGRYHVNEQPFSTFVSEKFHVERSRYLSLHYDAHTRRLYRECVALLDRMASAERETEHLRARLAELAPWKALHVQISSWLEATEHTTVFAGTIHDANAAETLDRLREASDLVAIDQLGPVDERQAWTVIAHMSVEDEVRTILAAAGFVITNVDGLRNYPAEEMARAEDRIAELAEATEHATERAKELSEKHYDAAVALVEALESQRDRLSVRRDFGKTERAFVITGWVIADRADHLRHTLWPFEEDIDLTLSEPAEGDEVPVELENPWWLRPFEVLTDLYGRPAYGELDPTPLLAPFFLTFFAICIGDVGYGAMLAAGSWLIKKKLDVAPGVKRFLSLMIFGGFAAMFAGVAFGSYFAIPVDSLPPFLQSLQLIDPLNDITLFLLFTMALGAVQVFFGVIVAAYDAFRRGDPTEAVFGQISTLVFFAMLAAFAITGRGVLLSLGLVGTMLMQGRAIQAALSSSERPAWDRALGIAWLVIAILAAVMMGISSVSLWLGILAGASVLLALVSIAARRAVIGLLGGAYAVYGMSSFIGDILSYTRLAALGLSGSLVGFVFNLLAGLVWQPAMGLFAKGGFSIAFGVLVAVMAVAVFVVGHVFNVVINLLGAFVHPARLQFVEFFSKFYEAGGRRFEPFRLRAENLVLETGEAGPEGGVR